MMQVRRRLFLFLCLLMGCLASVPLQRVEAQKKKQKRGNYYKAEGYFLRRQLKEAQDEIDRVLLSPKRAARSSTWYLRGQIYEAIYFSRDEELKESVGDSAMEAINAYLKTIELEGKRSEMFDNARKSVHGLCDHFIALGAEAYKLEDFFSAYQHFKKTLKVRPADSICLLFGGVSAQYAEKPDEALASYYTLKELYGVPKMAFWGIIELEMSQNEDTTKVMDLLREGQIVYPEDLDFVKRELDILIKQGRVEEAEEKLKETIKREPENTSAQLNLAIMYDNRSIESTNAGRLKEAEEHLKVAEGYYQNVLKYDAENFISNYNLGVIYVNRANSVYDKARKMSLEEYNRRGKAIERRGDKVLREAQKYVEKAEQINSEDQDVLNTLYKVYSQLRDDKNLKRIERKLNQGSK